MNSIRNKVTLIGHVGQAPEITLLETGVKMAKFSLATNETYKNSKGEKVTDTQWHNLVAWGKPAELIEKLVSKGQEIAVEGKLITRSFETQNGEKKTRTEILIREFLLLGKQENH